MLNFISITYLATSVWCFVLFLLDSHSCFGLHSNETDRLAYLAIKSQLQDPLGVTKSWNNSISLCQWTGVTCGHRHRRVTKLVLRNQSIGGFLSPYVGNLSFLRFVNLASNNLHGEIPYEHGQLPPSIGNLSALQNIDIAGNRLHSRVPESLGQLRSLSFLDISENAFSGMFHSSIFNISSLELIYPLENRLEGSLPVNIGFSLPNLEDLSVRQNNYTGSLPHSLSNASNLQLLDLSLNHFSGQVKIDFNRLPNLFRLNFGKNNLGTGAIGDLDFIAHLTNCSKLEAFGLDTNIFGGVLPLSIANLSSTIILFTMGLNQIYGTIPPEVKNLVNLNGFGLEYNQLTGPIPHAIGELRNLQLRGNVPSSLGNCQNLMLLSVSNNKLTGALPPQILGILTLSILLDLSGNLLTGSIPTEVGNLKNLVQLDLSENHFSIEIPVSLSACTTLEYLYMEGNSVTGSIPLALNTLKSIKELDLSRNNLSGHIPEFLENLSFNKMNETINDFCHHKPKVFAK
ncbi:hypothetical protein CISIN_1g041374mg, partial [Citrus sinensis]